MSPDASSSSSGLPHDDRDAAAQSRRVGAPHAARRAWSSAALAARTRRTVTGHGPGQEVLQVGKEGVSIKAIEPVGHYAVKLVFDDEHDSGLYSWDYLHNLGAHYEEKWQDYLRRLKEAGVKHKEIAN